MSVTRRSIQKAIPALLGLALLIVAGPSFADEDPPDRVARLSYLRGDVSFQPSGDDDWVEANHRMAKVLKAKGYEYQYLFCRGVGHSVGNAQAQFLPHAIEWVWKGYIPTTDK